MFVLVKQYYFVTTYKIFNALIELSESLIFALTSSTFFYLFVETFRQKSQTKNELEHIITEYKEVRLHILRELLLAEDDYLNPTDANKLDFGPKELNEYFTEEVFVKILNNLGETEVLIILRRVQNFLNYLDPIHRKFVKNGDHSLRGIHTLLKDIELRIEMMLLGKQEKGPWLALDWVESSSPKSDHPLYRLFCLEKEQDPYLKSLSSVLKRYS